MTSIVAYQKFIDALRTVELRLPEGPMHTRLGTELCTLLDGLTYVALPEGATLPADQPAEIADSIINPVTVTEDLREKIKGVSPHCRLIAERVVEKIREKYSVDDELYFSRITAAALSGEYKLGPTEQQEIASYHEWSEQCRTWGRDQRAALGL